MTVHLKKVCQGLMAHLLIKNALYIPVGGIKKTPEN